MIIMDMEGMPLMPSKKGKLGKGKGRPKTKLPSGAEKLLAKKGQLKLLRTISKNLKPVKKLLKKEEDWDDAY